MVVLADRDAGQLEARGGRLGDGVGDAGGQALGLGVLAALEGDGRDAVNEAHVAVGAAYGVVGQGHGEREHLVLVGSRVGDELLGQGQVARLAGVGEGYLSRCVLGDVSLDLTLNFGGEVIVGYLGDGVGNTSRQILGCLGLAVR